MAEGILLGTAAGGAKAATMGLFGSAGSFSPGIALSTLGSATGAIGAVSAGRAAAAQAAQQTAIAARQADYQNQLSASQAREASRRNSALLARQRAILAASGVDLSSGSALLSQQDAASQAELEMRMISASGAARANDLLAKSSLARLRASGTARESSLGAGTRLLSGLSKLDF